jgi:hypothetical protein
MRDFIQYNKNKCLECDFTNITCDADEVRDEDVFKPLTFLGKCGTVYSMITNFLYWDSLTKNPLVSETLTKTIFAFSILAVILDFLQGFILFTYLFEDMSRNYFEQTVRKRAVLCMYWGVVGMVFRDIPFLILNVISVYQTGSLTLTFWVQGVIGHLFNMLFSFLWKFSCFLMLNYALDLHAYQIYYQICGHTIHKVSKRRTLFRTGDILALEHTKFKDYENIVYIDLFANNTGLNYCIYFCTNSNVFFRRMNPYTCPNTFKKMFEEDDEANEEEYLNCCRIFKCLCCPIYICMCFYYILIKGPKEKAHYAKLRAEMDKKGEDRLHESKENELIQMGRENIEMRDVPPEIEQMEDRYIPIEEEYEVITQNEDIVVIQPAEIESQVIIAEPETKMVEINMVWYLFTVIYNIFFCMDTSDNS